AQAAQVIDAAFAQVLTLPPALAGAIHRELAECGISGGAVYDALVGLAAREHRIPLATRDARARGTYGLLGVPVLVVADSAETGRG
ncbi:MAG: VapC toxin family PIN domain ribonuclease, partial [Actinomycetia bacterium]|nr:VapC toxin family PIN domain ribonuclease [Actinomycetes bacterium]